MSPASIHCLLLHCPDQAVRLPGGTSLLSFISDAVVFPDPLLLRVCGFDPLSFPRESLTEQWPGANHTQERSWDRAAADAQRLRPGASPPQKKFTQSYSGSISRIMQNHNTILAPGFTLDNLVPALANMVVLRGLLVPLPLWGPQRLYQMSSQQGNRLSPVA